MSERTSHILLKEFFETHPAAARATGPLGKDAEVRVIFPEEPGDFRFVKRGKIATVEAAAAADPDFDLTLPRTALEEITGMSSDNLGEFAVAFFKCILADTPDRKVHVKLHSGLLKLTRRGYLKTMALGGPTVMMFLAKKGLKGPRGIKKAIDTLRKG